MEPQSHSRLTTQHKLSTRAQQIPPARSRSHELRVSRELHGRITAGIVERHLGDPRRLAEASHECRDLRATPRPPAARPLQRAWPIPLRRTYYRRGRYRRGGVDYGAVEWSASTTIPEGVTTGLPEKVILLKCRYYYLLTTVYYPRCCYYSTCSIRTDAPSPACARPGGGVAHPSSSRDGRRLAAPTAPACRGGGAGSTAGRGPKGRGRLRVACGKGPPECEILEGYPSHTWEGRGCVGDGERLRETGGAPRPRAPDKRGVRWGIVREGLLGVIAPDLEIFCS